MSKSNKLVNFLTLYLPTAPYVFIYMLQQVEYESRGFINWVNRLPDYRRLIRRKKLVLTGKALALLFYSYLVWVLLLVLVVWLAVSGRYLIAAGLLPWIPLALILSLSRIVKTGDFALKLKRGKEFQRARNKIKNHKGVKIAVLGSYGKTTMKELLAAVLGEGKKAAVTPGNRNVAISHARWINNSVTGDEDFIIFEFGEFRPGDVADLAWLTSPDYAVVTGYATAHLDTYKSEEALKNDFASILEFVPAEGIFASAQANKAISLGLDSKQLFDVTTALGWKIDTLSNDLKGLKLKIKKGSKSLNIKSGLVGRHLSGALAFAAAFADRLDLKRHDIESGIESVKPFEHRLQPLHINGAWVIDDTYNGNLEGVKAGLELLKELPGRRKIYVTPGLVEQGDRKKRVHNEIGELIAAAQPDRVVLMDNSARHHIEETLISKGFKGELRIEDSPLKYYSNLQYEIAAGDVVLLQNDWTDNYE